jgi:hypothetical protein
MMKTNIKIGFAIMSCASILINPTWADQVSLSSKDLRGNVLASRISVCSEIPGVDEGAISSFYSTYFKGWSSPIFGSPPDERTYKIGQNILFIASDGQISPELRECLLQHASVSDNLEEFATQNAESLGKSMNYLSDLNLPSYYGEIYASWGYSKVENWLIISFMSREDDANRINHALTKLFGLEIGICENSSVCEQQAD